jgi:hypothetical protein
MQIIDLPRIVDPRGNLSFIEGGRHVPFAIRRVYWVYDVPGGQTRGGHAYRRTEELIVALSGSFDVVLDDSGPDGPRTFSLNRSWHGLWVGGMVWRRLENFSTNALALVLASTPYEAADYIRDHDEFLKAVRR